MTQLNHIKNILKLQVWFLSNQEKDFLKFLEEKSFLVTAFYNKFDSYIIARNSGDTNYTILLPIYQTEGVDAELFGFETSIEYNLNFIRLKANLSTVTGKKIDDNKYLPMIPPLKGNIEMIYNNQNFNIGLIFNFADQQTKVDIFEEPTDGYNKLDLFLNYSFPINYTYHSITLRVENLFNTEFRNHLSRIKSIMPEPGRNINIIYKIFY